MAPKPASRKALKQPVPAAPVGSSRAAGKAKAKPVVDTGDEEQPYVDSSDEEAAAAADEAAAGVSGLQRDGKVPRPAPPAERRFDKDQVMEVVGAVRKKAPEMLGPEAFAEWQAWHKSTPMSLDEVDAARNPLPLRMPQKCNPAPAVPPPRRVAAEQQQLITYTNEGGEAYTAEQRLRDAAAREALQVKDVAVGTIIALKAAEFMEEPGYGTLFYIGDVVGVTVKGGDGDEAEVAAIEVHCRMPFHNGFPCNAEHRGWQPICVGRYMGSNGGYHHEWTRACETRVECIRRRAQYPASLRNNTSKYIADVDPLEVFETGITFTKTKQFTAVTKKRLRTAAPTPGEWDVRLGVQAERKRAVTVK
jgi:hypothetical protein